MFPSAVRYSLREDFLYNAGTFYAQAKECGNFMSFRKMKPVVWGHLLALMLAGSVRGQQAPQVPTPILKLSLKEAVLLGLKQNPQRVISSLDVSKSKRTSDISRSHLLPQAGISADTAL